MIQMPSYLTTITPWDFSVYIAPRDIIHAALPDATATFRSIKYLHGGFGKRLLSPHPEQKIRYKQVSGFDELMAMISETLDELLLIEYCDEWFSDDPDKISEFGVACKAYSRKRGTVILLSVKMNYVIRSLHSCIGRVQWVQTSSRYAISQKPLFVGEEQAVFRYGQQNLGV